MYNFDIKIERLVEKYGRQFILVVDINKEIIEKMKTFSKGSSITEVDYFANTEKEIICPEDNEFGNDFFYQFFLKNRNTLFIQVSNADISFQEEFDIPDQLLDGKILDGEDFIRQYKVVPYSDGQDVHPIANLDYVWEQHLKNPKKVWTLIDGENNEWCCAGFKYVNRFGFIITEEEWGSEDEEYLENNTFKIL